MEFTNNYKCLACGGGLKFDPKSGKVICEYCDSSYTTQEIEDAYKQKADEIKENAANKKEEPTNEWGEDGKKMREYSCPSCGAAIICEATTAASQCPYCDNPTIMETQFSDEFKPDYVLPFAIEKKKAIELLRESYKGKKLLPREFSDENHLEEIKGIYVPFWFFDGNIKANLKLKAQISTSVRTSAETTTTTKHYICTRNGSLDFSMIPTDASKKMPDDVMDSLEPFNLNELKPFSTAYLPGYYADKYDVCADDCQQRAEKRCSTTIRNIIESDFRKKYDSYSIASQNYSFAKSKVSYGLVPVWILYTKYQGVRNLFAINGQSGKLVGKLPIGKKESLLFFLKGLLIATIVDAALIFAAFKIF